MGLFNAILDFLGFRHEKPPKLYKKVSLVVVDVRGFNKEHSVSCEKPPKLYKVSLVVEDVREFDEEHSVSCRRAVAVVLLGIAVPILVSILVPLVTKGLLGFGTLGPIKGSIAASWQSTFAGFVPKGSLFSFLQYVGMVWKPI